MFEIEEFTPQFQIEIGRTSAGEIAVSSANEPRFIMVAPTIAEALAKAADAISLYQSRRPDRTLQ